MIFPQNSKPVLIDFDVSREIIHDSSAPINHIQYDPNTGLEGWIAFLNEVLPIRYPPGATNISAIEELKLLVGKANYDIADECLEGFYIPTPSAQEGTLLLSDGIQTTPNAINMAPLAVHECGHMYDILKATEAHPERSYYYLYDDHFLFGENLLHTSIGGKTFPNILLGSDNYAQLGGVLSTCQTHDQANCDKWSRLYLLDDDAGFGMLLEEFNQYTHTLAAAYALDDYADQHGYYMGARHAVLAFRWYVLRYLALARTQHPETYTVITDTSCNVNTVLTLWDRSTRYLEATKDHVKLNESPLVAAYERVANDPELLKEIEVLYGLDRECIAPPPQMLLRK